MNGATIGGVKLILRIEGLCVLLSAALAYSRFGAGWKDFAWFFLAPDLGFLGYLAGPRIGAFTYNTTHAYVGAIITLVLGVTFGSHPALTAGMIWCAHIGFDRALGYGLKYSKGFGFTHLGLIGRARNGIQPGI